VRYDVPVSGIKAIAFDVGETIINESALWLRWAKFLDVPPATLLGLMGAAIAQDIPVREYFNLVRPGFDWVNFQMDWAKEDPEGKRSGFDIEDLYPDAIPALTELKDEGYRLIISGNQPPAATPELLTMNLPVDVILNSADMGYEKPAPEFFAKVIELAECAPDEILYVGDRLDNDVLPALKAGLNAALIRRGVWGYLHAERPIPAGVLVIDNLTDLPKFLGDKNMSKAEN